MVTVGNIPQSPSKVAAQVPKLSRHYGRTHVCRRWRLAMWRWHYKAAWRGFVSKNRSPWPCWNSGATRLLQTMRKTLRGCFFVPVDSQTLSYHYSATVGSLNSFQVLTITPRSTCAKNSELYLSWYEPSTFETTPPVGMRSVPENQVAGMSGPGKSL